jgi:chaperonin cofactor prefoldin
MAASDDQTAIVEKFGELRTEVQQLAGKASELMGDLNEHETVIKTLEPFDGDRKAWRLVGLLPSTCCPQNVVLDRL